MVKTRESRLLDQGRVDLQAFRIHAPDHALLAESAIRIYARMDCVANFGL